MVYEILKQNSEQEVEKLFTDVFTNSENRTEGK